MILPAVLWRLFLHVDMGWAKFILCLDDFSDANPYMFSKEGINYIGFHTLKLPSYRIKQDITFTQMSC